MRMRVFATGFTIVSFTSALAPAAWNPAFDDRFGVVATETSGWGGPVMPMQGGEFLDTLGMRWWYDYDPDSGADVFAGYDKLYMYWKATLSYTDEQIRANAAAAAAAYPGRTIWWAMSNEPNDRGQANQSAASYADIYYKFHRNIRLGDPNAKIMGPGILNWDFLSTSVYQRGKDWYEEFRRAWYDNPTCRAYSEANYGVSYPPQDAFNFHAYDLRGVQGTPWAPEDWRYCRDQIQMCYADLLTYPEVLRKKIWLTEFAALRATTMDDNIDLTRQLVGWMRDQDFMERWFWFTIHSDRYWADSNPPRLELLNDTAQRTAVGAVAYELASLPRSARVDPWNHHYQTDQPVTYVDNGYAPAWNIVDKGGDHPRFELKQGETYSAGSMRGRAYSAGARILTKVAFNYAANYDNAKVRLFVDAVRYDGATIRAWTNNQAGTTLGRTELAFDPLNRIRGLGVGLEIVQTFPYALPDGQWYGSLDDVVVFSVPDPAARGDFDSDGDTDLNDFSVFQYCFGGPNRPPARAECTTADLDLDGDVDLADFARFQGCFNGPNRSPACP